MTEMTYQVEMSADTHNQLEKPSLTYRSRAEAVQAIKRVLETHGRTFSVDQDDEVITFLNASGGALAIITPVRAAGQAGS